MSETTPTPTLSDSARIMMLENDARHHEAVANRLEEDARNRRLAAENCRKCAEYIRKRSLLGRK